MRTDGGAASRQRFMHMHMQGRCGHLVFKFFRVNMIEGRLQESPQERKDTEDEAGGPHNSHQSIIILGEEATS